MQQPQYQQPPQGNRKIWWVVGALALVAAIFIGTQMLSRVPRSSDVSQATKSTSNAKKSSSSSKKSSSSAKKASSSVSKVSSSSSSSSSASSSTQALENVDPANYDILQYMAFNTAHASDNNGGYDITVSVQNNSYMNADFDLDKLSIQNGPSAVSTGHTIIPSLQSGTIKFNVQGDPGPYTYNILYQGQVITSVTFSF